MRDLFLEIIKENYRKILDRIIKTRVNIKTIMKPTHKPKDSKSAKNEAQSWSFCSLDLLGGSFSFNFNTFTGKFQTTIGSLLSLLMVGFAVAVFILLYLQYLDTSDPVVTQSTDYSSKELTLNLFKGLVLNPFAFLYKGRYPLVERLDKLFTIKGFLVEKTFNNEKNKFEYISIEPFDYKPCSSYKNKLLYKDFFDYSKSGTLHKYILCPDIEDTPERGEIRASPTGLGSKTLYIKIFPCSLPDRTQCEDGFRTDSASASILTALWKPVSSNYTDPLEFSYHSFITYFSSGVKRIFSYDVRRHRIVDVLSEFQGEKLRREYLTSTQSNVDEISRDSSTIYCPESELTFESKTCDDFLTLEYHPLPEVITLRRNYKKLTELFGEFGGIMKIGSILFIFYVIYNSKAKGKMLAREVFGYNKQKSSRVAPKGGSKNPVRHQKQGNTDSKNHNQIPKDIAKESVRQTLNVKNFVKKMAFIKLLRNIMTDKQDKELIDLSNLKQLIPKKNNIQVEAKHILGNQLFQGQTNNKIIENIFETEMWSLLQNSNKIEKSKKIDNKINNYRNQNQPKMPGLGKNSSTTRWMFFDEDEDQKEPENNNNNQKKGRKMVLESAKGNSPPGEEVKNLSLWSINESEQEAKINPRRSSPLSSASPKRRFKRGITPFSIRVRQKGSMSSNALEKSENINNQQG